MDSSDDNEQFYQEPIFKKAIIAAAFSQRLTAVLNEAHRIIKLLGTWPIIVHAGEVTTANREKLEGAINKSNFAEQPPLSILQKGNSADVIIDVAKQYEADLIIAGALAKEKILKFYLGSIARRIARQAPCSVLLLTDPQVMPQPIKRIHCAVEYKEETKMAIGLASSLAYYLGTNDLYYTHAFTSSEWEEKKQTIDDAQLILKMYQKEDDKLKNYLKSMNLLDDIYQTRCLYENTRAVTLNFTREIEANLFVIHGPIDRFSLWNRLLAQDLEMALQNLPCSILLTR